MNRLAILTAIAFTINSTTFILFKIYRNRKEENNEKLRRLSSRDAFGFRKVEFGRSGNQSETSAKKKLVFTIDHGSYGNCWIS